MYRYLIKKKVKGKNETRRNLSACVFKKLDGYEVLRKDLQRKESAEFIPIDIVYEPSFDLNVPVLCYFCSNIHLAYQSFILIFKNGKEKIANRTVRQCHYCNDYLQRPKII